MDLGLKERVALVTASSKGLGKAIASRLGNEGAHLVICARGEDDLHRAAEEIATGSGGRVVPLRADVSQYEDVRNLVEKTVEQFGRIDILVCNSGGPPTGGFLDHSVETWRKAIDLNLMSTIYLTKEVVPHMKSRKWGRIVCMTSVAVKQPVGGLILSNVVRAGVAGLSKSLANELAEYDILVNTVCPGYTLTKRVEELAQSRSSKEEISSEQVFRSWESQIPLARLGKPSELADLVAFLCSERASYITGATIQVDGGYVRSLL
jgi:3-oxoacyl-[acyl-carrier protein] reductase